MRVTYRRSILYLVIGLAMVFAVGLLDPNDATRAQAAGTRRSVSPDLFENQYVPAVGPDSVAAPLYPSPRPTPPNVGVTYISTPAWPSHTDQFGDYYVRGPR